MNTVTVRGDIGYFTKKTYSNEFQEETFQDSNVACHKCYLVAQVLVPIVSFQLVNLALLTLDHVYEQPTVLYPVCIELVTNGYEQLPSSNFIENKF